MFFVTLRTVLLGVHLLCVDVASAGPLICLWLEWKEGQGNKIAGMAGRYLAGWSVVLLPVGLVLGIAVGALSWNDEYRELIVRLHSKVFFGVWEFVFSLVLMIVHWIWWRLAPAAAWFWRTARMLLPLLSATNLLYHFSFLFVIVSDLTSSGQTSGAPIDAAAFRALMIQGRIYSRVFHFVLAALAVSAAMLILFAWRHPQDEGEREDVQRVAKWGAWIALAVSLLQIPIGIWVLARVPLVAQNSFLGGDLLASGLLVTAILTAFYSMHQLAAIAFGDAEPANFRRAVVLMCIVVFLMTGVLELSHFIIRQSAGQFVDSTLLPLFC